MWQQGSGTTQARPLILLVDDSGLVRAMATEALGHAGYEVITAESAEKGLWQIQERVPHLIISDVMMPGMNGYDFCRQLRQYPPTKDIPIMMLTARGGIQEKLQGFEAGASAYMVKPFEPEELRRQVRALLMRHQLASTNHPQRRGKVIGCFSLRGGAGTTTIAVNVAVALAQTNRVPVALGDFSLEKSSAALHLGLTPRYALDDVTDMEQFDLSRIHEYMAAHPSGVHLLASPQRLERVEHVTTKQVSEVLSGLERAFAYTVLDLAGTFSEANLAAIEEADALVLVVTPDVVSLKLARSAMHILMGLGFTNDRLFLVLNQTIPTSRIGRAQVEASLYCPVAAEIPYGTDRMVEALNTGVPITLGMPQHPSALALLALAQRIQAARHEMIGTSR